MAREQQQLQSSGDSRQRWKLAEQQAALHQIAHAPVIPLHPFTTLDGVYCACTLAWNVPVESLRSHSAIAAAVCSATSYRHTRRSEADPNLPSPDHLMYVCMRCELVPVINRSKRRSDGRKKGKKQKNRCHKHANKQSLAQHRLRRHLKNTQAAAACMKVEMSFRYVWYAFLLCSDRLLLLVAVLANRSFLSSPARATVFENRHKSGLKRRV